MRPWIRWALFNVAALSLVLAGLIASGVFKPKPAPLAVSPELIAKGGDVYRNRCRSCHADIPLGHRVAGWSVSRAYEVIGRLPETYRSMPAFPGDDEERRALAAWVFALGKGDVQQY